MKKVVLALAALLVSASVFAASYKNNTYQKLANEYTKKAEAAMDAGEYAESIEFAKLAEENAALSKAFIEMMTAKTNADDALNLARNQLKYAESIQADRNFPMAYSSAKENLENAEKAYAAEDYVKAAEYAKAVLTALDGIREITPLPAWYIVRPWHFSC